MIFDLLVCVGVYAQQMDSMALVLPEAPILSQADEVALRACPVLKLDSFQRRRTLPDSVDNSQLPFMTPIFTQTALECGQASSIVYTLSYEINCRCGTDNNSLSRRFPSHFAWNFCNGGANSGVSFMDSWQVIRTAGTPTTTEWGGSYSYGGSIRWASGYNLYYSAMRNRIVEFCAIPTDSEEGILTLKHWLDNHLCGDTYGGLANFYSTHVPNGNDMLQQLPAGTSHAGMWVVPNFQSNVNHAHTIVGYDDSICWDYNNDGRYTNDEDINHDGVVDIHDWEVGAVIFCNSFGTGFANQGYCYLPYRKLAELPAQGGIWNSCVYVVDVKDPVSPIITYKISMEHTCRGRIKLLAGVSTDLQATRPQYVIDWNVFNFQGGEHYMQGDSVEEQKFMELGLDVSRFLEYMQPNQSVKFFLMVVEDDVDSVSAGQVYEFSLMDYSGVQQSEVTCSQQYVPIRNNDTTFLSLVATVNFSTPQMQPAPPTITAFRDYSYQIPASGGTSPYRFEFTKEYEVEEFAGTFPTVEGSTLSLSNANSGYTTISLPFDFPFYDQSYDQLCIFADGYMTFRYNTYNWPFLQNSEYQILTTEMLAPFRTDLMVSNVQLLSQSDAVTIWVTAIVYGQASSQVNYAVKLYATGVIEFYYGSMAFNTSVDALSAISRGDSRIFQKTVVSSASASAFNHRCFRFTPPHKVDFLTLSREGVLSGSTTEQFTARPVSVSCFDVNDLRHDTILWLNAVYENLLSITDLQVASSSDGLVHAGNEVELSFTVRNLDSLPFADGEVHFAIANPKVTLMDSTEYFGYIAGGNAYTLNRAIRFQVDPNTLHGSILDFVTTITNDRYPQTSVISLPVYSHQIVVNEYEILDDNDGRLGALELDTLRVQFANEGSQEVTDLQFELRIDEPNISVIVSVDTFALLAAGQSRDAYFVVRPNEQFDESRVVDALVDLYVGGEFYRTRTLTLIGEVNCESFETGVPANFSMSDTAWVLDSTVALSGNYALRSGTIQHRDTSTLICNFTALRSGEVSFYYKTSSENNYDWLYFYLDGQQMDRWSGLNDWTQAIYDVTVGEHTLMWKYIKDVSVNSYDDCVWIDEICFPLENSAEPQLQILPSVVTTMFEEEPITMSLQYSSVTPIYLLFENQILGEDNSVIGWASVDCVEGSLNALESRTIELTINMLGFPEGLYQAVLVATVADGNTVTVPIEVTVLQTGVSEFVREETTLTVFPNPTRSKVTVKVEPDRVGHQWHGRLLDLSGRLIYKFETSEDTFEVNFEKYAPGIYFLHITAEDHTSLPVAKIIKR